MGAIQFESDGFALLPSFIGEDELAALACAVDAVLGQNRPPCMRRPGNDLVPLRWDDAIVARVLGGARRIAAIEAALRPRDLKWISAYVSTKDAHSPALWWHQDWWCWDHPASFRRDASQVALLCYLGETCEDGGALRILPGSHHRSIPLHAMLPEPHGDDANALADAHPAMRDHPDQITVRAKPGDAVVIDYRLLHGTHPNAQRTRRDCILLSFAPDWAALPDDIKGHLAMHPALPGAADRDRGEGCDYKHLLPGFGGTTESLPINRRAPAVFAAT